MRQPEAPIGWPSAIAPPFTFTFEVSQPIWRFTAIACEANASLISIRSRSFGSQPARASVRFDAGTGPMPMYFGSTPAEANALMRAKGLRPSSRTFLAEARITAAAPSLMPDALPAVTVPFLSNAGLRPFIPSSVAPWRGYSSSLNITGPLRRFGLVLARDGELILILARDRVLLGHVLGGDAHVVLVVDVPQAVHDHRVDELGVAHAEAVARAVQHMRREAHRLLAARDDDVGIAVRDRLRAEHRRFQSRAAHLVDGHRGNHVRQPGLDRGLARAVLADAGGQHLAHDHLGNLLGLHARALEHVLDYQRAKLRGGRLRQRATELADRGAHCADDIDLFH